MPYDAHSSQSKQPNAKHINNAELCARHHFKYRSMRPTAARHLRVRKYAQITINIQKYWQRELHSAGIQFGMTFLLPGQRGGMSEIF